MSISASFCASATTVASSDLFGVSAEPKYVTTKLPFTADEVAHLCNLLLEQAYAAELSEMSSYGANVSIVVDTEATVPAFNFCIEDTQCSNFLDCHYVDASLGDMTDLDFLPATVRILIDRFWSRIGVLKRVLKARSAFLETSHIDLPWAYVDLSSINDPLATPFATGLTVAEPGEDQYYLSEPKLHEMAFAYEELTRCNQNGELAHVLIQHFLRDAPTKRVWQEEPMTTSVIWVEANQECLELDGFVWLRLLGRVWRICAALPWSEVEAAYGLSLQDLKAAAAKASNPMDALRTALRKRAKRPMSGRKHTGGRAATPSFSTTLV
jgi:hypothetical protein